MPERQRIRAAHVEGLFAALRAHETELEEEFFHFVEIGRAKPHIGNVRDLDHSFLRFNCPP